LGAAKHAILFGHFRQNKLFVGWKINNVCAEIDDIQATKWASSKLQI